MTDTSLLYSKIVEVGRSIDRVRDIHRRQENSAQRLTWLSSQAAELQSSELNGKLEENEVDKLQDNLNDIVRDLNDKELTSICQKHSAREDFLVFCRAVLLSFRKNPETVNDTICTFFETVCEHAASGARVARKENVFGELTLGVNNFPDSCRAYLSSRLIFFILSAPNSELTSVDYIQTVSLLFSLLVKVSSAFVTMGRGTLDPHSWLEDDIIDMDGANFYNSLVAKLCRSPWKSEMTGAMVQGLVDLCLSTNILLSNETIGAVEAKINKILENVPSSHVADVAIAICELSTLFADRRSILFLIVDFFARHEDQSRMQASFGIFLSKLTSLVAAESKLGSDFAKIIDSETSWKASHFALLFSMQRSSRLEPLVLELIRKKALLILTEHSSKSTHDSVLENSEDLAPYNFEAFVSKALLVCETMKTYGWDLLVPSLVRLGVRFSEEDSAFSDVNHCFFDNDLSTSFTTFRKAPTILSLTGLKLLAACYRNFAMTRAEIHAIILDQTLLSTDSSGGGGTLRGLHGIRLLTLINQDSISRQAMFFEHSNWVKELVMMIPIMAPRVVHGIIKAFQTAFATNVNYRSIKDHAVIVCKKSLFQRDIRARLNATLGLLSLMPFSHNSPPDTAFEVLNPLRRILSQQCDLKIALYKAVSHFPEQVSCDLLGGHIRGTILDRSDDEDVSPFRFEACIDASTGLIIEPIHHLLSALVSSFHSSRNPTAALQDAELGSDICGDDPEIFNRDWLPTTHVNRFCSAKMPVFSIDKNSPFDFETAEGRKNRSTVGLIIGVCEVLIDDFLKRIPESIAPEQLLKRSEMKNVAALYRIQKGFRNIVAKFDQDMVDKEKAEKKADIKARKKKSTIEMGDQVPDEDVEDAEDEDEHQPKKKLKMLKKTSLHNNVEEFNALPAERGGSDLKMYKEQLELPARGLFLSEHSLYLLVRALLDRSSQISDAGTSTVEQGGRFEVKSLPIRPEFQDFVLSAIKRRLASVDAKGNVKKTQSEHWAEMAESASGFSPRAPSTTCLLFAKPLAKLMRKYVMKLEIARQQLLSNKQNVPVPPNSQASGAEDKGKEASEVETSLRMTLECLHYCFEISSQSSLSHLIGTILATDKTFMGSSSSQPVVEADIDNEQQLIHLAVAGTLEIASMCFSFEANSCAGPSLNVAKCLLEFLHSKPFIQRQLQYVEANFLPKRILDSTVTKHVFELYLDLSLRSTTSDGDVGDAFNKLALASVSTLRGHFTHKKFQQSSNRKGKKQKTSGEEGPRNDLDETESIVIDDNDRLLIVGNPSMSIHAIQSLLSIMNLNILDEITKTLSIADLVTKRTRIQESTCRRLKGVFKCLSHTFEVAELLQWNTAIRDGVLRCVIRTFKITSKLMSKCTSAKRVLAIDTFKPLIQFVSRDVTTRLDECVKMMETQNNKGKKQSRLIPDAVFSVEQFELNLLKLTKTCKEVNELQKYVRRMTSRDFKVEPEKLKGALLNDLDQGDEEKDS